MFLLVLLTHLHPPQLHCASLISHSIFPVFCQLVSRFPASSGFKSLSSHVFLHLHLSRLISFTDLSVGVNVSVNGFCSLSVSPVMNLRLIQDVPRRRPMSAGIGYSPEQRPLVFCILVKPCCIAN